VYLFGNSEKFGNFEYFNFSDAADVTEFAIYTIYFPYSLLPFLF